MINPFVSGQLTSNYYHINTTETQYYNSGSKMIEIILKENNECCYYTAWRENGLKIIEGELLIQNGHTYRDGLWTSWYKNGNKRSDVYYQYDYEIGKCTFYNMDGSIEVEKNFTYVDPIKPFYETEGYFIGNINPGNHHPEDGIWIYDGPFVTIHTTYKDWKENGLHQEWTSGNGTILTKGNYENGKKNGMWTYYHQDGLDYDNSTGIISMEYTYINGVRDGIMSQYDWNGNKEFEGHLKDNRKIGTWTYYQPNGDILKVENCDLVDCK